MLLRLGHRPVLCGLELHDVSLPFPFVFFHGSCLAASALVLDCLAFRFVGSVRYLLGLLFSCFVSLSRAACCASRRAQSLVRRTNPLRRDREHPMMPPEGASVSACLCAWLLLVSLSSHSLFVLLQPRVPPPSSFDSFAFILPYSFPRCLRLRPLDSLHTSPFSTRFPT
jgi:hypothetical protein